MRKYIKHHPKNFILICPHLPMLYPYHFWSHSSEMYSFNFLYRVFITTLTIHIKYIKCHPKNFILICPHLPMLYPYHFWSHSSEMYSFDFLYRVLIPALTIHIRKYIKCHPKNFILICPHLPILYPYHSWSLSSEMYSFDYLYKEFYYSFDHSY